MSCPDAESSIDFCVLSLILYREPEPRSEDLQKTLSRGRSRLCMRFESMFDPELSLLFVSYLVFAVLLSFLNDSLL